MSLQESIVKKRVDSLKNSLQNKQVKIAIENEQILNRIRDRKSIYTNLNSKSVMLKNSRGRSKLFIKLNFSIFLGNKANITLRTINNSFEDKLNNNTSDILINSLNKNNPKGEIVNRSTTIYNKIEEQNQSSSGGDEIANNNSNDMIDNKYHTDILETAEGTTHINTTNGTISLSKRVKLHITKNDKAY